VGPRWGRAAAALAAAALAVGGCTRANPDFCDEATRCSAGLECDLEQHRCRPAGDGGLDGPGPGDGGLDAAPADATPADTAPECVAATDCVDPARPICAGGTCRACGAGAVGDGECGARAPGTPACASGRCVECNDAQPCAGVARSVCDPASHACVPCTDAACAVVHPDVGVCVDNRCPATDEVSWVDNANASCLGASGPGSALQPFCSLPDAVARAQTAAAPGGIVLVHPSATSYAGFAVAGHVTVVGLSGASPEVTVQAAVGQPAAGVSAAGSMTLARLHLVGASSAFVVECGAATCALEELLVTGGGLGIMAQMGATLALRRSRITQNLRGGVQAAGADYDIVNNFIFDNGQNDGDVGGVLLGAPASSGGRTTFVNNSVAFNRSKAGVPAGISCTVAHPISNTIVWGNLSSLASSCVSSLCTVSYGLVDDAVVAGAAGAHNLEAPPPLFEQSYLPFDLHLREGSGGLGLGDPSGAPADDIDGDSRPADAIDIGADQHHAP
jgi:hypothetical protein